jgi:O-antigen/teichoic acid export membrane protein
MPQRVVIGSYQRELRHTDSAPGYAGSRVPDACYFMKQSTRLIINTSSMFCRMALTVGISLLITRLLLQHLGRVDFGLILALGATGALLQTLSGAMTTGIQRQLSFEVARNDAAAIGRVFSTGWVTFMGLGMGLWLLGIAITPVVMLVLTIPADRIDAAWWVYQLSLLNLVLVVTATPYQALIVSHQHLTTQAVGEVFTVLTRLAAVLLTLILPWDRMVAFVALQLAGYALVRWGLNAYCLWRYPGSWPHPRSFDAAEFRKIFSIAMWTVFGQLSWRFRMQGGVILLNIFFGPVVNGAYGIAMQIANYATTVSNAIRQAVSPAIVGAYAKGNRTILHRLALVTGKYVVLLLSFLVVPFWFEVDQVLQLWLGDVPPYTAILTRGVLLWMMVQMFTSGYLLANWATGDLGWYARRVLASSVLILVVAAIGFYIGLPPWFLPLSAMIGVLIMTAVAVHGIGETIELPPSRWLYESLLPTLCVLVPATVTTGAVYWAMPATLSRLFALLTIYALVAAPLIWWTALAAWERERFIAFAKTALGRLGKQLKRNSAAGHRADRPDETIA